MADLLDPTFWVPAIISVVGLILVYLDMRRRQTSDREASKIMFDLIATMRQELQLIKQQIGSSGITSQQSLLQRKEQAEWKRLTDLAKGISWLWQEMVRYSE